MRKLLMLAALVASLSACGDPEFFAPDDVGVLVVDAVLVVDEPFPNLALTRTLAPDQPFSFDAAGVEDATVEVQSASQTVVYWRLGPVPGVYSPLPGSGVVQPSTTYSLRVETAEGEVLTATTLTPGPFTVEDWVLLETDEVTVRQHLRTFEQIGSNVYVAPENQLDYNVGLLEARFTQPESAAMQVSLYSLDLDSDFVIDPEFFDEEDFADLDRRNFSPMFRGTDEFVRLPWFAIFFEGRYMIKVWATDRNWDELVRSTPSFNDGAGFGGNAGEGFERPLFRVNGGIGLFGSASVDSIGFNILPVEP